MTQTSGGPQPGGSSAGGQAPGGQGADSFLAGLRAIDMRRSPDGWFGGVCAGLAARLGLDPLIIRALFAVASLALGFGVLAYLLAWLLIPDSDEQVHLEKALRHGEADSVVLLVATAVSVFGTFGWFGGGVFDGGAWGGNFLWGVLSLLLLVGGGFWLWSEWRSRPDPGFYRRHAAASTASTASAPSAPSAQGSGAGSWPATTGGTQGLSAWTSTPSTSTQDPTRAVGSGSVGSGTVGSGATAWTPPPASSSVDSVTQPPATDADLSHPWEDQLGGSGSGPSHTGPSHPGRSHPAPRAPQPPQRPGRLSAGAAGTLLGLGLPMAVGGGLYWLATEAGWPGSPVIIGLAGILGALGLVVLVLGLGGRTSGFPGFLAVGTLVITALLLPVANNFAPSGAMGEYSWTPQNADELERGAPYRVGAGTGTLDLRDLTSRDLDGQTVEASVTFGQLVIDVPDDLTVRIDAGTAGGAIRNHEGNSTFIGGINVGEDIVIGDGPIDLTIDARVGFGEILLKGAGR